MMFLIAAFDYASSERGRRMKSRKRTEMFGAGRLALKVVGKVEGRIAAARHAKTSECIALREELSEELREELREEDSRAIVAGNERV